MLMCKITNIISGKNIINTKHALSHTLLASTKHESLWESLLQFLRKAQGRRTNEVMCIVWENNMDDWINYFLEYISSVTLILSREENDSVKNSKSSTK